MPRNGSGTYSLPANSWAPAVTGTTIESSAANQTLPDIAAALTQSISSDGQKPYSGNQPMGGNKLTGLADGTGPTDSVSLLQMQTAITAGVVGSGFISGTVGGSANAVTITPTAALSAYATNQAFIFVAPGTNTGSATLNVSSLGTGLLTVGGASLVSGDMASGNIYIAARVGSVFNLYAGHGAQIHNTELAPDALTESLQVALTSESASVASGNSITFRMPYAFILTNFRAGLNTAQTSGSILTVDLKESGTTVLSTKLTIDNSETTSFSAATPVVISDPNLADDAQMQMVVTQIGDGTAVGLKGTLIGYRTRV